MHKVNLQLQVSVDVDELKQPGQLQSSARKCQQANVIQIEISLAGQRDSQQTSDVLWRVNDLLGFWEERASWNENKERIRNLKKSHC